jgi:protein tyrosine/serine phosphatase
MHHQGFWLSLRWLGKAVAISALGVLAVLVGLYLHVQSNFNLHAVEAGLVYRSGQLSPGRLTSLVRDAGIRSVINLRGEQVGVAWYDQELRITQALGVTLINYPISARSVLSGEQMQKLSALIRDAEKPVLIHCSGGADRTGLACAVYCVDAGQPRNRTREQLSAYFGHFPHLLWQEAAAMDVSLERYFDLARVSLAGAAR